MHVQFLQDCSMTVGMLQILMFGAKFSTTSLKNGESREGGGSKKKINICLVSRRSVVLITFKIAIKT